MKKTLISLILLLVVSPLMQRQPPGCPYHSGAMWLYDGRAYPSGQCMDNYHHMFWDYQSQRNRMHYMSTPCP